MSLYKINKLDYKSSCSTNLMRIYRVSTGTDFCIKLLSVFPLHLLKGFISLSFEKYSGGKRGSGRVDFSSFWLSSFPVVKASSR